MIDKKVEHYLKDLTPSREQYIEKLEEQAARDGVPIMDLLGMESLLHLLKMMGAKHILEIGTAIGYSAIRMAQALPEGKIVTIERDKERFDQAVHHVNELQLQSRIDLHFGDALQLGETLEFTQPFDVLFIDAAKGQYQRFFELFSPFVRKGGVILSDNVLFRGLVAEETIEHKRHKQLSNKINTYNQWLMDNSSYDTRIVPIGDGLAISIKH